MPLPALAAAVLATATGSILVRQSLEDLTRRADVVVRATVARQDARWSPDGRLIYTFVTLRVEEAFKGEPGAEVVVRQPGGSVGEIGQRVDGSAEFAEGERVIVFLGRLPSKVPLYQVEGMSQGKLALRDAGAQGTLAVQDTRGAAFLEGHRIVPGRPVELPLADVVARIRRAVGR